MKLMTQGSVMNLRQLDLNLLVVFDAVMHERSVTRAAHRVFLTQSAVSSALSRLRVQLKDELFLRGTGKLRPTPRALELELPVRALLTDLERVLQPEAFDPQRHGRTFTIATNDYFTAVVAPKLAQYLEKHAQAVDLRIIPIGGRANELLDASEADVVCTSASQVAERLKSQLLIEDDYVCVVRKDHPFAKKAPSLAQYAKARHLLVTPRGDARGFVDEQLAERGLTRRVAMTVNHFAAAPQIVAQSDMVLTALGKIAERFAPPKATVTFDFPLKAPLALRQMSMIWHARLGEHPAQQWLRSTLAKVCAS
jgi:DNA-binding transcriptional LysR family regulator